MENTVQHEKLGTITYEESFWTGRKSLSLNGNKLNQVSKNVFQTPDGTTITLKGNFLLGTKATVGTETIVLSPALKWYEIVLSIVPFIFIVVWGNVVTLCKIIPIIGGALGGAFCGLFIVLNLFFIKKVKNIFIKILITIGCFGLCFLICFLLGLAFLSIL